MGIVTVTTEKQWSTYILGKGKGLEISQLQERNATDFLNRKEAGKMELELFNERKKRNY